MRSCGAALVVSALCALSGVQAHPSFAQQTSQVTDALVYIECALPDGRVSKGTGVLVTQTGRVLTAKHVAPPTSICKGIVGDSANPPNELLIRDPKVVPIDGILLKFTSSKQRNFIPYCRIDGRRGQDILVYGFPSTGTGNVNVFDGVIASDVTDSAGIFPTGAMTTTGMSGGPVVLKENGCLIGIIAGGTFDPITGAPASYGVLAAQEIAVALELVALPGTKAAETSPAITAPKVLNVGPLTLAPGEAKDFSIRLGQPGTVDIYLDSANVIGNPDVGKSIAVRICSASASVDTPCPHSQAAAGGVVRRTLPAGPATVSLFNFATNPAVTVAFRAEY